MVLSGHESSRRSWELQAEVVVSPSAAGRAAVATEVVPAHPANE